MYCLKNSRFIVSLVLASFCVPFIAAAQKLPPPVTAIGSTLKDFIDLLVSILQAVGIPILVIFIIYSGYMLVTAGDNEQQTTKAKSWIAWTVVGAAIILGAQIIADFIFNTAALF